MRPGRAPFVPYTASRHTCITRHMDPFTLHVLAGHRHEHYVHPNDADILEAFARVNSGALTTFSTERSDFDLPKVAPLVLPALFEHDRASLGGNKLYPDYRGHKEARTTPALFWLNKEALQ